MRKIVLGLLLCLPVSLAHAQSTANVTSTCGTPPSTYVAGQNRPVLQDTNGNQCTNPSGGSQPTPLPVTPVNRGGTITLGGTSQTLAAANASRNALCVENPASATSQGIATAESLFVNVGAVAATLNGTTSFEILPGGSGCIVPGGLVDRTLWTINAATTGHQFVAKEW